MQNLLKLQHMYSQNAGLIKENLPDVIMCDHLDLGSNESMA